MVIAMDGLTASGKGTIAKLLARRLDFMCLDTGAIYRAITVFFLRTKPKDDRELEGTLRGADIQVKCSPDKKTLVFLNGEDITEEIRSVLVGKTVATLGGKQFVQDRVREIQYRVAKENNLVVEGRETTSVAFPNAEFKFYVTAELDERARRRLADYTSIGKAISFEEVKKQIEERDRLDITREVSPLVKVPDAIEIDTTTRNANEVVDEMLCIILK